MHVTPGSSGIKKLSDHTEMLPSNIQPKAKHDKHPNALGHFTDNRIPPGSPFASHAKTSINMLLLAIKV